MKIRTLLAGALAVAALAVAPLAAHAQSADAALDAIDELVHEWEDGAVTAEEALEEIEVLIHDVPASERTGALLEIDEVVHHWEDGEVEAEAAMEEIEGLVHGAVDHGADPAPASTGNAGPLADGGDLGLAAGLLAATALLLGAARTTVTRR